MAERLKTLLEQGNYYEYEQLTKTLFFKLVIYKSINQFYYSELS